MAQQHTIVIEMPDDCEMLTAEEAVSFAISEIRVPGKTQDHPITLVDYHYENITSEGTS